MPPLPRSIPARAGEPLAHSKPGWSMGVYPRACGGTRVIDVVPLPAQGLSPRVRGNPTVLGGAVVQQRSIPARAGEPVESDRVHRRSQVYPRACGGTHGVAVPRPQSSGLSPRVRGNPPTLLRKRILTRSIPARAGEPVAAASHFRSCRVYPRACGGTRRLKNPMSYPPGLSPRVRGNPGGGRPPEDRGGSIPARAGEPTRIGRTLGPK